MRVLLLCLALAGCGADPCDAFPDDSCIALEVHGPGLAVDQIGVTAAGFPLDGRSPTPPHALTLPVVVPVVADGFGGTFALTVRGYSASLVVGEDLVPGVIAFGQHIHLVANLVKSDGGGADLARASEDLAGRDLAGADLTSPDLSTATAVSLEPAATSNDFMGVFGFSATNVYAVTLSSEIFRRGVDGTWKKERSAVSNDFLMGVWGTGPDDVYAFGAHWGQSGSSYLPLLLHSTGNGQWGTAAFPGSDANFAVTIESMGGTGRDDLYAGVSGTDAVKGIYHSDNDGQTWTRGTTTAVSTIQTADAIFAIAPNDAYIGSAFRIFHTTGNGNWQLQNSPVQANLNGVWAGGSNDIYMVGSTTSSPRTIIFHSTGIDDWTEQALGVTQPELQEIFGASPADIWAVGSGGTILHSTGFGTWAPVDSFSTRMLRGVWATAGHAFVVGDGGIILHLE